MGKRGRNEVGRAGEDLACSFLREKGHMILERNYRTGHLEIDIISLDEEGIHFVEVKTRVAPVMAEPQENVRRNKRHRMTKAAEQYLAKKDDKRITDADAWLDVIAVTFYGDNAKVEYFPNAYVPIYTNTKGMFD